MKIFYSNIFKNYFFLTLTLFTSEVIFRIVTGLNIVDWALLRIFIGANIIGLIVSTIASIFGRIAGNIITFLFSLAYAIYAIGQAGFYNYLGVYMSFGTSSQAGAVKDYIKDYLQSFKISFWFILIPVILLGIFYLFIDPRIKLMQRNEEIDFSDKFDSDERKRLNGVYKKHKLKSEKISGYVSALVFVAIFIGCWYSTLVVPVFQNKIQITSTKSLFQNPSIPNIAMSQFGFTGYLFVDVKSVMFPVVVLEEETEYDNGFQKLEQVQSGFMREINDKTWEAIIADEKNADYKKLSNYYISQEITDKNAQTGIFKDMNLIVIMMESTNNIVLNEKYYPNIYKLYSEGWAWDNSYSPRNSCSTGNNEMSGMVSLYTINTLCTTNTYKNNVYPQSIFNLFKNAGYTTSSYHNYTDHYYARSIIHPNMGSEHYYDVTELGIPYSNVYKEWPSDVELVEKFLEITKDQEKFMAWLTVVSAHQPYTESSTLGDKYLDLFKDTNYNLSLKRYMSKLKEFDNAIGALLEGLEEQGKLDNTVIVLYDDHYPYGLTTATIESYFGSKIVQNEIDRTPFIIYNSAVIQPQKFDEYTSYMNLVPTVANLFDLDYDPRLYAGKDLLSADNDKNKPVEQRVNRVIFADGSWKDPKAFYNALNGKITYTDVNDKYTDAEIAAINKSVKNRISMSNLAIKKDYFKYLDDKMKEYKEETSKKEETVTN